eukprot:5595941-Pleurochrysis_carterae.AAC.1
MARAAKNFLRRGTHETVQGTPGRKQTSAEKPTAQFVCQGERAPCHHRLDHLMLPSMLSCTLSSSQKQTPQ